MTSAPSQGAVLCERCTMVYRYRGVMPPLWPERLLLCHLGGDKWIVVTPDENVCVLYLGDADLKELRVLSSTGEWPTNIEDMLHLFQTVPIAVVRDDVCGKAVSRCHVHVPPLSPVDGSGGVGAALPSETRKLPRKASEAEGAPGAGEIITEDVLAPVVLEVAPSMAGQDWFLCAACPGLSRFAEAVREGYLSCAVKSDKGVFVLYDGNAACGVQKIAGAADKDNKLGARGSQSLKYVLASSSIPYIADESAMIGAIDKAARTDREEIAFVKSGVQILPTSFLVPPASDKGVGNPRKKQR